MTGGINMHENYTKELVDVCDYIYQQIGVVAKPANTIDAQTKKSIKLMTSFLNKASTMQRAWHIKNASHSVPLCQTCGIVPVTWDNQLFKYRTFCSSKCAYNDPSNTTQSKKEATNIKRYGSTSPLGNVDVIDKIRATTMEKYGVTNNFWATRTPDGVSDASFHSKNTNAGNIQVHELVALGYTQAEIGNQLGITQPRVCNLLNRIGLKTLTHTKTSKVQREVQQFLDDYDIQYEINKKLIPPRDVDLWIPDRNLAIEVDGVYWHSELAGKDRQYHKSKTTQCNAQGIRLIHIFDTEWNGNQDVVKSRILNALGRTQTRIYARECVVGVVDQNEAADFFSRNHIQRTTNHKVCVGLRKDGKLVAAMSFGSARFSNDCQYELIRCCSLLHHSVVGGPSRMFQYFIHSYDPESIITYSDVRWNTGNMYEALGFEYTYTSSPNYFYFNRNGDTSKLLSRQMFQKHKLSNILQTFDPELTEWENMVANGYDRIWDCGNTVWKWKKPE